MYYTAVNILCKDVMPRTLLDNTIFLGLSSWSTLKLEAARLPVAVLPLCRGTGYRSPEDVTCMCISKSHTVFCTI